MNVLTNSVIVSFLTMFSTVNFDEGYNIDRGHDADSKFSSVASSSIVATGSLILQEGLLFPSSPYTVWLEGDVASDVVWQVAGGSIISGQGTTQLEFRTDPNPFIGTNNLSVAAYYTDSSGQQRVANASRNVASGGGSTPIEW